MANGLAASCGGVFVIESVFRDPKVSLANLIQGPLAVENLQRVGG